MKNSTLSIVCLLLIGFVVSCQDSQKNEAVVVPHHSEARARRACSNQITYGFVLPDSDYGYNGDGCISYYIHRGSTRQVKVRMSNNSGTSLYVAQRIEYPDNPGNIQYSVASITGGSTSTGSPIPGTLYGAYILWEGSVPAYTTYELTLNITGVTGASAAENGIVIRLMAPCTPEPSGNCEENDNMHVVLTD